MTLRPKPGTLWRPKHRDLHIQGSIVFVICVKKDSDCVTRVRYVYHSAHGSVRNRTPQSHFVQCFEPLAPKK